jgi:hypothetical protein
MTNLIVTIDLALDVHELFQWVMVVGGIWVWGRHGGITGGIPNSRFRAQIVTISIPGGRALRRSLTRCFTELVGQSNWCTTVEQFLQPSTVSEGR